MTPNLTDAGKNLLLRALTGDTITFTKIQLGNGPAQDASDATELSNPLLTVQLSEITLGDEYVTLSASFNNAAVESGFRITEIGFWAQDPDDTSKELLYAIGHEEEGTADYVPDNTNRILEMQFDALLFVGDAENVAAIINSSLVYASAAEFKAHVDDVDNPHAVTKAQVGLSNVPNVATNDQTVTYSDAEKLETLTSGEKLSAAFAKIKLAITNLIGHIGNKANPHGVTAEQAGAAAKTHTHSAADINQGVLSPMRGGTGEQISGDFFDKVREEVFYRYPYHGDGAAVRFIRLGFTPKAVFVTAADGLYKTDDSGNLYCTGGLALSTQNAVVEGHDSSGGDMPLDTNSNWALIHIAENGFYVKSNAAYGTHTNDAGTWYNCIAFK